MRHLITTAATAAAALLAGCGTAGTTGTGHSQATSATPAPAASCHAQFDAWKRGPARTAAKAMVVQLRSVQATGSTADVRRLLAAIKRAGHAAAATAAYPIPPCADPHGYYAAILTRIQAAADDAGTGKGLGAVLLALVPLKQIPPLQSKLSAELQQTVGAKEPFGP